MSLLATLFFAAGTAFFYLAASTVVQSWGASPYVVFVPALFLTLAVGARFETQVLRNRRLGRAISGVLALEALLTAAMAAHVMGDALSLRETAGAIAVFGGIALIGMAPPIRRI